MIIEEVDVASERNTWPFASGCVVPRRCFEIFCLGFLLLLRLLFVSFWVTDHLLQTFISWVDKKIFLSLFFCWGIIFLGVVIGLKNICNLRG